MPGSQIVRGLVFGPLYACALFVITFGNVIAKGTSGALHTYPASKGDNVEPIGATGFVQEVMSSAKQYESNVAWQMEQQRQTGKLIAKNNVGVCGGTVEPGTEIELEQQIEGNLFVWKIIASSDQTCVGKTVYLYNKPTKQFVTDAMTLYVDDEGNIFVHVVIRNTGDSVDEPLKKALSGGGFNNGDTTTGIAKNGKTAAETAESEKTEERGDVIGNTTTMTKHKLEIPLVYSDFRYDAGKCPRGREATAFADVFTGPNFPTFTKPTDGREVKIGYLEPIEDFLATPDDELAFPFHKQMVNHAVSYLKQIGGIQSRRVSTL